jgi:hypothetical protein
MRILFVSLLVTGIAFNACAADPALPVASPLPTSPSSKEPAVAPAFPSSPATLQTGTNPPPAPLPQPVIGELTDGSKVEFGADGSVWVLAADGNKSQAPDGVMSLKDGTPFVVKNGKRVNE